jgi:hypothetical protein
VLGNAIATENTPAVSGLASLGIQPLTRGRPGGGIRRPNGQNVDQLAREPPLVDARAVIQPFVDQRRLAGGPIDVLAADTREGFCRAVRSAAVADIQKRGSYTPRRVREQRAYRLVVTGGVAGAVGVVTLVLAVAGVIGAGVPVIAFIVAAICLILFRQTVSGR